MSISLINCRWITDSNSEPSCWHLGTDYPRSSGIMDFRTAVFLAKFFSGTLGSGESCFRQFLLTFANQCHPSATRSLVIPSLISSADDTPALLEIHLRHLGPVTLVDTPETLLQGLTLALERQVARIPWVPQTATQSEEKNRSDRDLCLEERALSVSLLVFPCGTFRLIVLGDEGVPVEIPQPLSTGRGLWKRIGIYPWNSGKGAGLSQFLVALFLLLEAWHRDWHGTLNAIDNIISFEVITS